MTITNTTNKIREDGDGAQTEFDFPFKIFNTTDIEVYKVVKATGVETLQTISTDYTVSINAVTEGGTVTFTTAPTATEESLIKRVIPRTQPTDIPTESNLPESQLENELDRSRMIDIQLEEELDRSIKLPITTTLSDITLPTPEAGKGIVWNSAADGLENSSVGASGPIDTGDISGEAVTTPKIEDGAVTLAKLAADAVDGTKIADDAIDSEHYVDGSIDLAHLSASAKLQIEAFTFSRDTSLASGTQVISGLSIQPIAAIFLMAQTAGVGEASWGVDDGTNAYCIWDRHNDTADSISDDATVSIRDAHASSNEYTGKVSAFNSDGFDISWTKTGTPTGTIDVYGLAFGY